MAKPNTPPLEQIHFPDRAAWRAWLLVHHAASPGIWLVYTKKHTGQPSVSYDEAVEEALCFGWVDSRPNVLDEDRYMQMFTPRKAKSPWSKLNKERVARLTASGQMHESGLDKIEAAQQDGSWDVYNDIEDLSVPDDLAVALSANPEAARHFAAFSPSSKKNILWWIASAKKPETRDKRITETVTLAARGKRANHPVDRD